MLRPRAHSPASKEILARNACRVPWLRVSQQHERRQSSSLLTISSRRQPQIPPYHITCLGSVRYPSRTAVGCSLYFKFHSIVFPIVHLSSVRQSTLRPFSSRGDGSSRSFKLDALPFSVSPEEAIDQFEAWATDEQGLRYLLNWNTVQIGAAYVPVWSFDVNVRFVTTDPITGRRRYDAKPDPFGVYRNDTVHLPGLSAYAGHSYRRSLINPVHNTSLVFMGDKTVPFGSWMLRPMKLGGGEKMEIFPDPWNATKGRAFAVVQDELESLAEQDKARIGACDVQTEILSSRRVYMPTYAIEYRVLGAEYRAFVSGCDAGSGVSGVSHRVFWFSNTDALSASNSFLSQVQRVTHMATRTLGSGSVVLVANLVFNLVVRVLARLHIVGLIGTAFVGFRKVIQPWMDNRTASAEWERQREHEAQMHDHWDHTDDFVDTGFARQYFQRNRAQILGHLGGEHPHREGDFDWYKDWEEWARRQYEKQQEQDYAQQQRQRQQYEQQQRDQQRRTTDRKARPEPKKKKEYKWDFDPNDPYSVLGIERGASKTEVSQAFRREMLKHHPDTQTTASPEAKERALERSKLITEAYRKIKAQMK